MRTIHMALLAWVGVCSASIACAQYGLYGSPETLSLPQEPAVSSAYPTTTGYPYQAPAEYSGQATAYPAAATSYPYQAAPYASTPSYPVAQPPAQNYYTPAYPSPQYGSAYPQQTQVQSQTTYRFPSQPPAATAYQPYQAGSQYRYPSPSARPTVRTASAMQPAPMPMQPIPAPPGMAGAPSPAAPSLAPAPQGSGMMGQMLCEPSCNGCYGCDNGAGVYRGAVGQYEQAACAPYADNCGGYMGADCYCPWYASVSALVMSRSGGRRLWTSNEPPPNEAIQLSNTDIPMSWRWGGEVKFGRRFCCYCVPCAIEATYWTLDSFNGSQTTSLYPSSYINTPLITDNISFPLTGSPTATAIFNGARRHTVSRHDELHNVEVNFVKEQLAWGCDSPWDIGWAFGVRYFRYEDSLRVASLSQNADYDAYFEDTATNSLVGAQLGFDLAYNVGGRVRLFLTPKFGIYNNFIDSDFQARARQGAGNYVDGVVNVGNYPSFPAHGSINGVSFLTQIDVGVDWQFANNWSARFGYRVLAATGMALADDQYPEYLCDTPEMANPQHTSSLVLHGAFMGITYNF